MARKKHTKLPDSGAELDDLGFDLGDFDSGSNRSKKGKPIRRLISNVGKGSLGHFTKESFIRSTLRDSLPGGYDTVIDSSFEIRDKIDKVTSDARKSIDEISPELRETAGHLSDKGSRFMPHKLRSRLKDYSESGPGERPNADEELLKSVLGEVHAATTATGRQYVESRKADLRQNKLEAQRSKLELTTLANIDAKLAHMRNFNDQIFSRYQRRSLEVQYRQYFAMRDMLKLQGSELAHQREVLGGILHNTALADYQKDTRSATGRLVKDQLKVGGKTIASRAGKGILDEITDRLADNLQSGISGAGMGLSALNMGMSNADMLKDMGISKTDLIQQQLAEMATGVISKWALRNVASGMDKEGFISRVGLRGSRFFNNLPANIDKYSKTASNREGLLGDLENTFKDILYREPVNNKIGGSAFADQGEATFFRNKTRTSIETVMPGYLSRILREIKVLRTGDESTGRLVYDSDKEGFVSEGQRRQTIHNRLFGGSSAKWASEQASEFVDKVLAGKTVNASTHDAFKQQVIQDILSGKEFDPVRLMKLQGMENLTADQRTELRPLLRGMYNGPSGRRSEARIADVQEAYRNLQTVVPDYKDTLSAMRSLGMTNDLMAGGFISRQGDKFSIDNTAIGRQLAGSSGTGTRTSTADKNDTSRVTGFNPLMTDRLFDRRQNLYKPNDLNNPVITAGKILTGGYINARTGKPVKLMADILDGVIEDGQVIIRPDEAVKLVNNAGETLPEIVEANKQRAAGRKGSYLSRAEDRLQGLGSWIDTKAEERFGYGRLSDVVRNEFDLTRDNARVNTQAAARRAQPYVDKARGGIDTAVNKAQDTAVYKRASTAVRNGWSKVMNVKKYALDIYRRGETRPVITAAGLKAGNYINARTGQVITDMRDIFDGVKDKTGKEILSSTEADNVVTQNKTKLKTLISKAQNGLRNVTGSNQRASEGITTDYGDVTNVSHSYSTSGASPWGYTQQATSIQSTLEGLDTPETDTYQPSAMYQLVEGFKEANLEKLDDIIASVIATGTDNEDSEVSAKKKGLLRRISGKLGRGYGKYLGGVGKLYAGIAKSPFKIAGALFGRRDKELGSVAADVYVKGERKPRLNKGAMLAGLYYNTNKEGELDGVIKTPADITSPVADPNGNILISQDDLLKGLVTRSGKSLTGGVISLAGWVLGKYGKGIGGYYGLLFKGARSLGRGVRSLFSSDVRNKPIDVYTLDDLATPKLYATGMRAGSYVCLTTEDTVKSIKDIKGPVADVSDYGNIKLKQSDIANGLVDFKGDPLHVKSSLVGGVLKGAAGLAGKAIRGGYGLAKGALKTGFKLAASPFKLLSRLTGIGGGSVDLSSLEKGQYLPTADTGTHMLLEGVLDLLDNRLPETDESRKGSWRNLLEKRREEELGEEGSALAGSNTKRGSILGSLAAMFGLGGAAGEDDDGDNYYGAADFSGDKEAKKVKKKAKKAAKKEAKAAKKARRAGKKAGFVRRTASKVANSKVGNTVGKLVNNKATRAIAGWGGKALRWGGMLSLTSLIPGVTGVLGGLGTAAATTAGAIGSGAAAVGGALATGAAAAGTGLATVFSLPVLLGTAAVAGVGYLAYKGYKYVKLHADAPLRKLRMAQYGINMENDVSRVDDVQKLEAIVAPMLVIKNGEVGFDKSKLTDDKVHDILKLFGIEHSWYNPLGWFGGSNKEHQRANMFDWMKNRFRPVFFKWVGALHRINKSINISQIDSKLSDEEKLKLIKKVSEIEAPVYTVGVSPWDDKELDAGPDTIARIRDEVKERFVKDEEDDKSKSSTSSGKNISTAKDSRTSEDKLSDATKNFMKSYKGVNPTASAEDTKKTIKENEDKRQQLLDKAIGGRNSGNWSVYLSGRDISNVGKQGKVKAKGKTVPQPGRGTDGDINDVPLPDGKGLANVWPTIYIGSKIAGMAPDLLAMFAGVESHWNPLAHAGTSSAAGMFQFIKSTWTSMINKFASKYGINPDTPPEDGRAATLMMCEFTRQNQEFLKRKTGKNPTDVEMYMAHFLGAGGALSFLQADPNAVASSINYSAAQANKSVFYKNGRPRTVQGVIDELARRVAGFRKPVDDFLKDSDTKLLVDRKEDEIKDKSTKASYTAGGIAPPDIAKAIDANKQQGNMSPIPSSFYTDMGGDSKADKEFLDNVQVKHGIVTKQAQLDDIQAKENSKNSQTQMKSVTQYLRQQTKLQSQMVSILTDIESHTGKSIPALLQAKNKGEQSNDEVDKKQDRTNRPRINVTDLPTPAVSMQRSNFS